MSIQIFSPLGQPEVVQRHAPRSLAAIVGAKIGYVFNQHTSALSFWKSLEAAIGEQHRPSAAHRLYKTNTWAPAPKADIDKLISETDYAVVGVGA
ncbi:MAG TPA: hypothetical protein VED01_14460 [Burkholderiales bacterium]|nr:hypothetical protein [Burkholderiales bacterium]